MTQKASAVSGMASRLAAHGVMMKVLKQHDTVEKAVGGDPALAKLNDRDRAFAMQLVMTTLRWKGIWDVMLANFMAKPMKAERLDITICLYLGMTQLLHMQVADHAAVDTSVNLAKKCFPKLSGLVNAVLKRVVKEGEQWLSEQAPESLASASMPQWMYKSLRNAYGEDAPLIASAHRVLPPTDIQFKQATQAQDWALFNGGEVVLHGSIRLLEGIVPITQLEGFEAGDWWVQDIAASLPVRLLGDVSGKNVLDCCAAPGGKTMQLAAAGAQVTALDSSSFRMKRVEENLQRTRLQAQMLVADALSWQPSEPFDAIMLDAPCSATGTIRRHPELPWQRTEQEVARLVKLQRELLSRAIDWLKPGGVLVYAVCSLLPQEGEEQVKQLLESDAPVKLSFINASELGCPGDWVNTVGFLRTLPCFEAETGGMDGFFAARLIRV